MNLSAILLAAILVALAAPPIAAAGCPGCEEYLLDIPEKKPSPAPATPASPAPVPAAPATAPVAPAPEVAAPVVPTLGAEPKPKKKPVDTDPDPVPENAIDPPRLASVPAVAASEASQFGDGGEGGQGMLPLAIGMAAIAIAGAAFGLRRGAGEGEDPRSAGR